MNPTALRTMLMGMVLSVQIATVVVVVMGMRQDTATQFADNARTELALLADNVVDGTQRYLEPAESAIEVTRNLAASGLIDSEDNDELAQVFEAQLRTSAALVSIFVGRVDGSFMVVERSDDGLRRVVIPAPGSAASTHALQQVSATAENGLWAESGMGDDPRRSTWYTKARETGDLIWTSAYSLNASDKPGITAARHLRLTDGSVAGVLGVDVDIQPLSAFIAKVPNRAGGTAVILDDNHKAVAFSDQQRLADSLKSGTMPSFESLAAEPLKALSRRIGGLSVPNTELPNGFGRLNVAGEEHLGMARRIALSDGQVDWMLMVQAPAAEYSGGMLTTIMESLRTLIATILIPGIVAMFVIFRLTAPVFEMHENATTDHLTGALNRSEFERRLTQMMRARREHELDTDLLVVALDLDGFKEVNDRYGHGAGDAVLRIVVSRLQRRVRKTDLVGRIGGDEFMVALRLSKKIDQVETIRQIRHGIVSEQVKSGMGRHWIGVTAGVALQEPGEALEHLVERADHALVTGKARRKNCLYVARTSTHCATPVSPRRAALVPTADMKRPASLLAVAPPHAGRSFRRQGEVA